MDTPLVLGNAELDDQHRALHRTMLQLNTLAHDPAGRGAFHECFSRYTILVHEHFVTEERIMAELGLAPSLFLEHKQAHDKLLHELTETHLAEMFGSAYSPAALCEMVAGWLLSHLEVFDEPLAAYFKP